jgi:hypothetical protein
VVVVIFGAELEMTIDSAGGVVSVSDKESVTCGVKLKVPVAEGVPEISPVEVLRLSPVGNVSVMLHVKDVVPVPLCSWSVWLYGVPTVPPGKEVVEILGGTGAAAMVMDRA